MRKLTIKRQKSFVACLVKMKVYIQDDTCYDIEINGVKCRKIGTIKNGEEKAFEIGEEATRVYVIADSLSKKYCSEFYPISEGNEDIYLTGKNRFSMASGNAFRFDNLTDPEAIENRKKGKGIVLAKMIIAGIIGFCIGYFAVTLLM